ncbi:MAG: hypothetical protein ACI80K_004700, partial [Paracoccaceae bacterium]
HAPRPEDERPRRAMAPRALVVTAARSSHLVCEVARSDTCEECRGQTREELWSILAVEIRWA